MRWSWVLLLLCGASMARGQAVTSFDDIAFWAGSGANSAAMAIDWREGSSADESLVWGFRWDGAATREDMFRAIVAADPRLFAKVEDFGGALGIALYGFGYDNGDGNFALTDGTTFDADGFSTSPGPADGATAEDPADLYGEGWFTAFWHYGVSTGNPYDGGSWSSSNFGMTSRALSDGDWDSWAYTPTFDFSAFAQNPHAAPVPALPGDVNFDGVVNGQDISLVASHWLHSGRGVAGDATGDGVVNGQDISMIASHWLAASGNAATTAVPEPAPLLLAAIGAVASLLMHRSRRVRS